MSSDLKYPYQWGKNVINDFVESYPRGTEYLAKLLGKSAGELRHSLIIVLCSGKHMKYKALKRMVKENDVNTPSDYRHLDEAEKIILYKCLYAKAIDDVLDQLNADEDLTGE